jgi:signal transduction histidine kinase/CheY-like chemotaxis protein
MSEVSEGAPAWQALYESVPDPLITVDGCGNVLAVNAVAREFLADETLVGHKLTVLFDASSAIALERLIRSRWVGAADRALLLVDGRRVTLNASAIAGAVPARFHVALHDATNRQIVDDAVGQQRRMSALADLAGAVARELNDPMSIVQGRLELLLELGEADPAAIAKHLAVALEHARRVSAALHNLRLVGRSPEPELGRLFVSEAIQDACDLVGARIATVQLRIDLDPLDLDAGGDSALVARVLANLVNHAVEVTPRGGVATIRGRRDLAGVVVQVIGGHVTTTTPGAGDPLPLGSLGLSVADTLVRAVGGRLDARRCGGGVVFTVVLPDACDRPVRARPVEQRLLVVGGAALARTLETVLGMDGFELIHAADGESALGRLETEAPVGAVATELLLGGMSGLSLADEIHRLHPRLRGRVLLITDAVVDPPVPSVVAVSPPLGRVALLEALGRRVRRRR